MRIAIAGIHTESSTWNPVYSALSDFRVLRGAEVLVAPQFEMLKGFEEIEFIPIIHARAIPGGRLERAAYETLKAEMLDGLVSAGPLDGLWLAMHGAMFVDGMEDAEGDWVSAARSAVGPSLPISTSYDLHGNVSERVIDAVDMFAAYRTAPHIDWADTQVRALSMLVEAIKNDERPVTAFAKVPVLLPGERTSTEDEPARSLYLKLYEDDNRPGIWDANLMVGYVWADEPRATACAVVTGTDKVEVEALAAEIAQRYWDARNDFAFGSRTLPLDQCIAEALLPDHPGPVILADSGDNPTGGGVGDRPDVLKALLGAGCTDAVIAGIADQPVAEAAFLAGKGADLHLSLGATLDKIHAKPVEVTAKVLRLDPGEDVADRRAVLEISGLRVVVTAKRRPFHNISDFTSLGIEPEQERLIVVKSGYLSPDLAPIARPSLMALTEGVVDQDIPRLPVTRIPRPTFPFDRTFDWLPVVHFSKRALS